MFREKGTVVNVLVPIFRDLESRFVRNGLRKKCGLGSVVVCPGVAGGTGMLLKVDYHVLECVRSMLESSFGV